MCFISWQPISFVYFEFKIILIELLTRSGMFIDYVPHNESVPDLKVIIHYCYLQTINNILDISDSALEPLIKQYLIYS